MCTVNWLAVLRHRELTRFSLVLSLLGFRSGRQARSTEETHGGCLLLGEQMEAGLAGGRAGDEGGLPPTSVVCTLLRNTLLHFTVRPEKFAYCVVSNQY